MTQKAICPYCETERTVTAQKLNTIGTSTYLVLTLDCACVDPLAIKLDDILTMHNARYPVG